MVMLWLLPLLMNKIIIANQRVVSWIPLKCCLAVLSMCISHCVSTHYIILCDQPQKGHQIFNSITFIIENCKGVFIFQLLTVAIYITFVYALYVDHLHGYLSTIPGLLFFSGCLPFQEEFFAWNGATKQNR